MDAEDREASRSSAPVRGPSASSTAHRPGVPTVIIAKTVKGRGVSFMENAPAWHGAAPNDAQAQTALAEIAEGLR